MERMFGRALRAARRAGVSRVVGAVYVPDRMATAAERRYFDSLVGVDSALRDPRAVLR